MVYSPFLEGFGDLRLDVTKTSLSRRLKAGAAKAWQASAAKTRRATAMCVSSDVFVRSGCLKWGPISDLPNSKHVIPFPAINGRSLLAPNQGSLSCWREELGSNVLHEVRSSRRCSGGLGAPRGTGPKGGRERPHP